MKIAFTITFFLSFVLCAAAQKPSKGEEYIKQIEGKLDKAKISIDKTLTTPDGKLSAENWYLKGYICTELAKSEVYKTTYPNAQVDALNAIKKSIELDVGSVLLPECINVLYDLSSMFYNKGIKSYNNSVTTLNTTGLSEAVTAFELFFEVKTTLGNDDKIVTSLLEHDKINLNSIIFYTAFSAQKCGMNDKAVIYYSKIIDPELPDEKAKLTALPLAYIYYPELLVAMGDQPKAINVMKKGARLFPDNVDVIMTAIDYHKKAGMIDEMSEFLELALKASPNNPKMLVVLAGAYTTIARSYDKKGYAETSLEYRLKAIATYEKAMKSNPQDKTMLFNINYNMGILYYNPGVQAYKKQNEAGRAEAEALFGKSVVYLEKALELDKSNKNVINMLLKCYQTLNDTKRAEELEKLLY